MDSYSNFFFIKFRALDGAKEAILAYCQTFFTFAPPRSQHRRNERIYNQISFMIEGWSFPSIPCNKTVRAVFLILYQKQTHNHNFVEISCSVCELGLFVL